MNAKPATYWISTILMCGTMAYFSYGYLTHAPRLVMLFASLGYPPYFPTILGTAKFLGIVALLLPGSSHLKEWAYAAFTFTFIGAIFSHLAAGQPETAVLPLVALLILAISFATRPADRRPALESEAEHDGVGGMRASARRLTSRESDLPSA